MIIDTLVDATLDFLSFVFIQVIWEGTFHLIHKATAATRRLFRK